MALKRTKPEFTLLRGAVPKPAASSSPAPAPAQPIPATQNSLSPTTVIYWGYWKSVGGELNIPGATASTSSVTGVTGATGSANDATTTDQAALQKSQGSFLYKIAPAGATA